MIELPSSYKILCRIHLGESCCIQAIKLSDYENIINRFSDKLIVDALCLMNNRIYSWSRINSIEVGGEITCHKLITNKNNLFFDIPAAKKSAIFVTLNDNFLMNDVSPSDLLLGSLCFDSSTHCSILSKENNKTVKSPKAISYFIKNFLKQKNYDISLYNEQLRFNLKREISIAGIEISNYLRSFSSDPYSSYRVKLLFKNGFYNSLILSNSLELDILDDQCVPFENYWLFQLKYGKSKNIYSHFHNAKCSDFISIKNIEFDIKKTWHRKEKALISIKASNVSPVIINSNFAMRLR